MNDYAAAPVQPIAQGLVTVGPGPNFTTTFFGRGVQAITRTAAGAYRLVLDEGLPGNAGETEPLPVGLAAPAAPDGRTMITLRAGGAAANISAVLVGYAQTAPPPADGGLNVVEVFLQALIPTDADFEIVVWLGVASAQL
jgi:hypothetical protein